MSEEGIAGHYSPSGGSIWFNIPPSLFQPAGLDPYIILLYCRYQFTLHWSQHWSSHTQVPAQSLPAVYNLCPTGSSSILSSALRPHPPTPILIISPIHGFLPLAHKGHSYHQFNTSYLYYQLFIIYFYIHYLILIYHTCWNINFMPTRLHFIPFSHAG